MTKSFRLRLWGGSVCAAVLLTLSGGAAYAQGPGDETGQTQATSPATPAAPSAAAPSQSGTTAPGDPVIAKVNGEEIHLSDVTAATRSLPPQARQMPPNVLYPMILDQLIDRDALVIQARKEGLQNDPDVKREVQAAEDRALQTALLRREVGPTITDVAVRARYDRDYKGKSGEEEAHARHILVPTEQEAKDIIAQLKKGADFAKLAKQYSKDQGSADGGDLGWFKRGDMVPAFSDAAFGLKPGQFTQTPVQSQFGWHVILLEGLRQAPTPSFDDVKDEIRQKMIQEGVQKAVQQARAQVQVQRFNMDGSTPRATDTAEPPPAPGPGAPPGTPAEK